MFRIISPKLLELFHTWTISAVKWHFDVNYWRPFWVVKLFGGSVIDGHWVVRVDPGFSAVGAQAAVTFRQARSFLPSRSSGITAFTALALVQYQVTVILLGDRGTWYENNLPEVDVQQCSARSRALDLLIASLTLYQLCHQSCHSEFCICKLT